MVEIVYFPKKCPKCSSIMRTVTKMYASWYECVKCEFVSNRTRR